MFDARLDFDRGEPDEQVSLTSIEHAHQIQKDVLQETAALTQQNTNSLTSIFVQLLGTMGDMIEQRLAADEKRIPSVIWTAHISISVLTCFVVGYSMRRRLFLTMIVLPLTIAIVLSLVAELDNREPDLSAKANRACRGFILLWKENRLASNNPQDAASQERYLE